MTGLESPRVEKEKERAHLVTKMDQQKIEKKEREKKVPTSSCKEPCEWGEEKHEFIKTEKKGRKKNGRKTWPRGEGFEKQFSMPQGKGEEEKKRKKEN